MSKVAPIQDETLDQAEDDLFELTPTINDGSVGSLYPFIVWLNGSPQHKGAGGIRHSGGFFVDDGEGIQPANFKPYTHIDAKNNEIPGVATRDLEIVPVRMRHCFTVDNPDGGLPLRFGPGEYDEASAIGKVRSQTHLLCHVEGVQGGTILTFKGMSSAAVARGGGNIGVVRDFRGHMVKAARRLSRQRKGGNGQEIQYPMCAFRLIIGPAGDRSGKTFKPDFTEVGSGEKVSHIAFPIWVDRPKVVDTTIVRRAFVGKALYAELETLWKDSKDWEEMWTDENLANFRNRGKDTAETKPDGEEVPEGADTGESDRAVDL